MKKSIIVFTVILFLFGCKSQSFRYERIQIYYVSLNTLTNHRVPCDNFEKSFSELELNKLEVLNEVELNEFRAIIAALRQTETDQIQIDTRAKIRVFVSNNSFYELCVGNTFTSMNNKIYYTSVELGDFLLTLPLKDIKIVE